jgi:hypothetical protein
MSNKIPLNKAIPESPISYISPVSPVNLPVNLPKLHFGGNEFFTNAKPASMLEKGLKLSTTELSVGDEGLYMERDGPTIMVKVKAVRCIPIAELHQQNSTKYKMKYLRMFEAQCVNEYIFTNVETGADLNPYNDYERDVIREWTFYTRVDPVPFVYRRRGLSRQNGKRKLLNGGLRSRKNKAKKYTRRYSMMRK